ncbi:inactive polyglycylase TTLL10 [Spea bombifrons]|uniref:inactive polyglycylase TTLL10 n=1 Tax=Spea bombifrons TaxID=233779 RepID=UPI00234BCDFA|nr:inactive polyglycylase TTLL10 [Spea bombifrons]
MSKAGSESSPSENLDETENEVLILSHSASSEVPNTVEKKPGDPRGQGPFFYIGGNNGANLVSAYCTRKGWQRIQDNKREDYKLKWCETKRFANYYSFRQGQQLLYQIPNNKILTTKIGLLSSLREYERVKRKISKLWNPRVLKMEDFFPETYRLDIASEREAFFLLYDESQTWICKPTGLNQGRGIFLLKNAEQVNDLRHQLQAINEDPKRSPYRSPQGKIAQRYIPNPLLLGGRKFDVRSYMVIASTVPYFVFFHHGYVRLTCNNYDPTSDDLTGHLTNQYMQKKHPLYSELKEETVWSMERFNNYVNETYASKKGLPQDWVLHVFTKRMQQIMTHCFLAVKSKLDCRMGYFDLIGCDFLIDENFKVWLLEMNCNPALHTNCEVLKDVIPGVVNETLDLALEIFGKTLKSQSIMPLKTQSKCVLLFNGELNEPTVKFNRSINASPIKVQNEPVKTIERHPQGFRASVHNGTRPMISKITPKPTLTMSTVHIMNNVYGKLPYIPKQKLKNEAIDRVQASKNNDVSSDVEHPKNISLQSAPVAKFSFTNLHKLRVTGSKTPQNIRKNMLVNSSSDDQVNQDLN